jgi:NAD(P)-dependent dehydrogenase (short-subunit alcohol dehydrogenase family)
MSPGVRFVRFVRAHPPQVIIVTGGNSGTGYITSRSLYHAGAKVYLACRNESKALDAIERIKAAPKPKTAHSVGKLVYLNLDLMDLESVDRFADEFLRYVT